MRGIDPRVVVVRGPGRGVAAARNIGIQRGRAPVVAFLDSDNLWLPDHLATVLEMLERHPDAVLATTCRHYRILGRASARQAHLRDALVDSLLESSIGYASCIAVRRWALERIESFDERLPVAEDTDLWVRLAIVGPFVFLRRRTVVRRETPGSLMAWGGSSGAYLAALEHHGNRVAELLAETPGKEWLGGRARGLAVFARALKALDDGSDLELRALLRRACELHPELHKQAELVAFRVCHQLPSVSSRAAYACTCARCAAAWPDQAAVTAHWLRVQAVLAAAGARRPDLMAAVIRGWRPAGAGRLLLRVARSLPRRLRDAVEDRQGSGAALRGERAAPAAP